MSRSKSASNVISLKKTDEASLKQKKRISFGHDEIRYMEPNPGIKSRLGFGNDNRRPSSPPPPELDDIEDQSLKTELKKIAVGKGKFELKRVMKVVNEMNKSALRDSVTPERTAAKNEEEFYITSRSNKEKTSENPLKISIRNDEYKKSSDSYTVDKVDLALRAAKLKVNLDQRREQSSSSLTSSSNSRKRLVKVETLIDGTKVKTEIDPDDPILDSVPIKKLKSSEPVRELKHDKKIKISDNHMANDFKVTRPVSSLYSDQPGGSGGHRTLAQKADMARTKHDSREMSRRSEERPSGVKSRLNSSDGYKSDDGMSRSIGYKSSSSSSSMRDRIGPGGDSRDYGGEKSPRHGGSSVRDRVGVRDAKSPSIRDRLGDHTNGNSDSRKIYSRLGNRD